MTREDITKEVTEIFKETFREDEIVLSDDMTADDINNWDSLTHTIMIANIEKHFSVKFKIREVMKLKNVGILINSIENKIN